MSKILLLFLAAAGGFRTMIGGQALLEGILMIGPDKKSVVVRKPDGSLEVQTETRKAAKHVFTKLPLIRGVVNFGSSMYNGVKALLYSAEFFPEDEASEGKEEAEASALERWIDEKLDNEAASSVLLTLAMLVGVGFSIFLFFLLPTALGGILVHVIPGFPLWGRNLTEGLLRVVLFLGYLILCSRTKDIHRTFQYHGAEHKTIFCYERGLPLTVENVRAQPKHHPRCGTSFLFVVIFVSIVLSSFVFSWVQVENTFLRMGCHVLLLPVVVALTYEINRFVGRHDNLLCRAIRAPGMGIQRWTTFEPDDSMIEVGIRALQEVLPDEAGSDRW